MTAIDQQLEDSSKIPTPTRTTLDSVDAMLIALVFTTGWRIDVLAIEVFACSFALRSLTAIQAQHGDLSSSDLLCTRPVRPST